MDDDFRIEQIHRYLSGEMDATEQEAFEEAMEHDEGLKKAAIQERQLLEALERSFDEQAKEDIAQVHRQLQAQGFFDAARGGSWKQVAFGSAVAATVIGLCAGIWWFTLRPNAFDPEIAYGEHFRPETTKVEEIIEGLASIGFTPEMNSTDSLREALATYRNGSYPEASESLERFLQDHPQNDTAQFYLALTELSLSKFETAAGRFSALTRQDDPALAREAQWYYALACLRIEGRKDDARQALEQLAGDSQFDRRAEARQLVAEMKD